MNSNTVWDYEYWMKSNGMFVGLNTPDALESKESKQGLPPYAKRKGYLVDKYPACPKNWMESKGRLASYFVPVQEGKGMWLDFNKNFENDYHVAIVVSVQGINPLTGIACDDEHLEQYVDNCPKCSSSFKPDRYCEKCNMKYPKQNYLCTTSTPVGRFWLDGFRTIEGAVRQYILTAEKMKGVASNLIGKDRVFAIGVSFFLSKEKKKANVFPDVYSKSLYKSIITTPNTGDTHFLNVASPSSISGQSCSSSSSSSGPSASSSSDQKGSMSSPMFGCSSPTKGNTTKRKRSYGGGSSVECSSNVFLNNTRGIQEVKTKSLEVGAGATIDQNVYDDTEQLSFWRDEPEAVICINYALEEEVKKIISQGSKSLEGHKEGFLKNVPVGN
jgi:hypothetical protein